jgi:capsid protein
VSNAIIASRYYLETELKDKIIEEIDILTKSVNYAIAESTNNESGISTQVNSVVDTKPADMSVMIWLRKFVRFTKERVRS